MSRGFPRIGSSLLFVALTMASACQSPGSMNAATGPSPFTSESGFRVTAEPVALRAELLPDLACSSSRAFGTRVIVVVSGGTLASLRFRFTDRFGVNALPHVRVIPGSSPMTIPVTMIPPLTGIPIPGLAPAPPSTLSQASNAQRFPFFLTFGCGLSTNGVVSVTAETVDGMGRAGTRELRMSLH